MAWVGENRRLPAFEHALLPSKKGDVLELDELWSFVARKTQPVWLWLALCRRTRQIVAYTIGERDKEGALNQRERLPSGYRRCATRSDFWLPYEAASRLKVSMGDKFMRHHDNTPTVARPMVANDALP